MHGKERWMDNEFIEGLRRSVNYEDIYLMAYGRISDLRKRLVKRFGRYNDWQPHKALGNETTSGDYNNRSDGKARKETA
jgi:putative transposase